MDQPHYEYSCVHSNIAFRQIYENINHTGTFFRADEFGSHGGLGCIKRRMTCCSVCIRIYLPWVLLPVVGCTHETKYLPGSLLRAEHTVPKLMNQAFVIVFCYYQHFEIFLFGCFLGNRLKF